MQQETQFNWLKLRPGVAQATKALLTNREEAVLLTMAATIGRIMDYQQLSETLQQEKTRSLTSLQQITANVPGLIYQALRLTDGSFSITFASAGCWELFEVNPEQVMADYKTLTDLLHPDDRESFFASVEASACSGTPWTWEGRFITPSGKLKWVQGTSRPEQLANGEILWNGIFIDTTERKQTQERVIKSEALYRTMAQNFPNGTVLLFDTKLRYIIAEGTGLASVGLSKELLEGKTIWQAFPPQTCVLLEPVYRAALAGTATVTEVPYGSRIHLVHTLPVKNDEGEIFAGMVMSQDITERKQAEEAINRERRLFMNGPVTIFRWLVQEPWRVEYVSPNVRQWGYQPEDFLSGKLTYADILHPDDTCKVAAEIEAYQAAGLTAYQQDYRIICADGEVRWVYDFTSVIRNSEGNVTHYEGYVLDITDRKQAEAALRESEEKFSLAFRFSPDAMAISTLPEGRYLEVNDSFLRQMGYCREEVINRTSTELNVWVNLEDRTRMLQMLQETGTVSTLECEFRRKSGEVMSGLFSAQVINIGGEPRILSVINDITERKRAETQVRLAAEQISAPAARYRLLGEMQERIRQSLELTQILNTTVTEVRQFLQCDRVFIGYTNAKYQGQVVAESVAPNWKSLLGFVPDDDYLKDIQAVFEQQGTQVLDDVTQAQVSPLRAQAFARAQAKASLAVPIVVNHQFFGILVANQCSSTRHWQFFEVDLLEKLATQVAIAIQQAELYQQVQAFSANLERQVEERTQQLQQKMQELQELYQVKDVFLHAFSHDLRNPMTGMSLVLKNLLNQPGETVTVSRSLLERIIQSSDRQLNLINSLLEAHSSQVNGVVLHREPVQLADVIQASVEDLEPLVAQNQATLTVQLLEDLPIISADATALLRVFENLIANALKHNPPGLSLTLSAKLEDDKIRCTVADNGVGMSQQMCDRLFDLYYRGGNSRHFTGIGLGLYLCRQIIHAHGGEIGVISSPGSGATFWFTLPLTIH